VFVVGFSDGPAEVHRITMARQILAGYAPAEGLWPSEHLPARRAEAAAAIAALLEDNLAEI
jgi:acyl-CoA dehydrogenase